MNNDTKEKLVDFFSQYRVDKYKKRQLVLSSGEKVNYIGFLKSGFVRVYSVNNKGEEATFQMFKPMLFFTSMLAISKIRNSYSFEALTPVEMWKAPVEETMGFLRANREIGEEIMKDSFENYLTMAKQLSCGLSGNAYSKVAGVILSLNKILKNEKTTFAITHRLIASMTGMTRETVTLQMLKMEKEKLIDNKNKKVVILNMEKLRETAQEVMELEEE